MDKITIVRYDAAQRVLWDDFVENARNATFLFKRDYMDYHADRFADHSLIVRKGGHDNPYMIGRKGMSRCATR